MQRIDVKHIGAVATKKDGSDPEMTRDEALAKLREIAIAAGVTVKRGRIYVPGRPFYFAGDGNATPEGVKSMWTEFGYAIQLDNTYMRDLGLVERLQKAADAA